MDRFFGKLNWFGPKEITENHIFSLVFLVIITFILCILIYVAIKKQKIDKAPSTSVIMVEGLITMGDNYASDLSDHRLDKANPYFISLFCFLFFGHIISLFGLVPIGSSLSVVFAATAATWFTTIGIGFAYQKIKYLFTLLNPIEIAGNISPLISLTFRLFGNIIGGIVLITLLHISLDKIWIKIIKVSENSPASIINPISMLITPFMNLYLDIFVGAIQAFVFMTLTISYWSQVSEVEVKEKVKDKVEELKENLLKNNQYDVEIPIKTN